MVGYRKDLQSLSPQSTEKTLTTPCATGQTNLTFTGNPKTFIRDTHDTPFPKQRRNTESLKPNEASNRKVSQSQKTRNRTITGNAITQYTNNYKAFHTHSRQTTQTQITKRIAHPPLLHTREKNNHQNRREHPIEEPPQNERNHIHRQRKQHAQFTKQK